MIPSPLILLLVHFLQSLTINLCKLVYCIFNMQCLLLLVYIALIHPMEKPFVQNHW